jgi:hypothetical protein
MDYKEKRRKESRIKKDLKVRKRKKDGKKLGKKQDCWRRGGWGWGGDLVRKMSEVQEFREKKV